ncbi:hypothetical protein FZEAL_9198 [Fusarium zealandicum]|uniref:Uncharacterized protein n=1 Tax=Fusarium zealandicum TaxID=1053134 RepID=A0A8H4UCD9_9HYPO|nr:hypothetical protein FZEAL_9198 [Fusarium zealandicum]
MTAGIVLGNLSLAEPNPMVSPPAESDAMRGRKRERSMTRGNVRSIRCPPSDESSTLRGRSRCRAASPSLAYTSSRASSPRRVLSPTRRRLLHARLRREHCPSRVASPIEQQRPLRRQRTRSRSRGPRLEMELETARQADVLSGLRNEVRASSSDEKDETKTEA